MTGIIVEFMIVLIGLAVTVLLFYRMPTLREPNDAGVDWRISVIIPARNEEKNLHLLLEDLKRQTLQPCEIICVDDASDDGTAQIATAHGAQLISLRDKPSGWMGKSWACQNGADTASGELLLFLDADVRLGKNGIRKLAQAYADCRTTVSVQPYHRTEKLYEQCSLFFNLIQIAANGMALPKPPCVGLYGPVILMPRGDYDTVGGHRSVRDCVVEDMALGTRLKDMGLAYRLFLGNSDIAFRMYSGGLRSLLQGWTKNVAAGAAKTPYYVFLMVFFWIASLISVPIQWIKAAAMGDAALLVVYSLLYMAWVVMLFTITQRVGRFYAIAVIAYPLLMLVFLGVFMVSLFKKVFGIRVFWKGRAISAGKR